MYRRSKQKYEADRRVEGGGGVPVLDWLWGAYESDVMPKINGATAWSNLAKLTDGLLVTAVNIFSKARVSSGGLAKICWPNVQWRTG
jgi:hypothetical protein